MITQTVSEILRVMQMWEGHSCESWALDTALHGMEEREQGQNERERCLRTGLRTGSRVPRTGSRVPRTG